MTDTKECSKCHEVKPLDQFSRNKRSHSPDGRDYTCKKCIHDYYRERKFRIYRRSYQRVNHKHVFAASLPGVCLICRKLARRARYEGKPIPKQAKYAFQAHV